MAELLPYLELRDPTTGRCHKLIDNCYTLAVVAHQLGHSELDDCDECCADCEQGDYLGDPAADGAWWYDPNDPNTADFWGFLAHEVYLEPSTSIRRRGETTAERPPWTPRRLTITGRWLGNGPGGLGIGESSFLEVLTDECGPCDGWEAVMRLHCPDHVDEDVIPPEIWVPDGQPPLIDYDGCEPCANQDPTWEPKLLGPPPPDRATNLDSGRRNLIRLRFVYMDDIQPPEGEPEPLKSCSRWVQIVFEVQDDFEWGDPISGVCNLDRGWDNYESGYCRPHDWTHCLAIPKPGSCDDPTLDATGGPVVEQVRSAKVRAGRYCAPLYRSVRACLTPQLPTSAEVGLGFRIKAGGADLRNMRFDLYPAFHNVPSPETCEGELIYRRMVPCGQLRVPYLPANSELFVDGRRRETWLTCRGAEPVKSAASIENWGFPLFDPACRMWVVAVVDCLHHADDLSIDLTYYPRYRT